MLFQSGDVTLNICPVDEAEYKSSAVGLAFIDFVSFFERTTEFYDVGKRGLRLVERFAPLLASPIVAKLLGEERAARASKTHRMSEREVEDEFEFFAAVMLIAGWAAFEAYIDDVCRGELLADPSLTQVGPLSSVRLRTAEATLDYPSQVSHWLRRGIDKQKQLRQPISFTDKIDSQLELVGLHGAVLQDLADNVNTSKLIRNVWAHKAGVADQYFIDNAVGTNYSVGDTVSVRKESLYDYRAGLMSYAVIVVNRFRQRNGMRVGLTYSGTEIAANPFKAALEANLLDPVPFDVLAGKAV